MNLFVLLGVIAIRVFRDVLLVFSEMIIRAFRGVLFVPLGMIVRAFGGAIVLPAVTTTDFLECARAYY